MSDEIVRRDFTKLGTAAAIGLATSTVNTARAAANDRVRLGIIGVGNRGGQLIDAFLPHDDCEFVAISDVYKPYLAKTAEKLGGKVDQYEDYRKILDRKDIDAVIVATPDHWHALQTIEAADAGKDIYVEKPLSSTIVEGRKMVDAVNKKKRVGQVGLHRRSIPSFHQLAKEIQDGRVGKVTVTRAYRISNMAPNGIGHAKKENAPADLNWDAWVGPRAEQAYQDNIAPYKFRWWLGYSSQMGNWGVHYFDALRWMLGEAAPKSVVALGGRYAVDDDRTIPDTAEAVFELPGGSLLIFGQYEASGNPIFPTGEMELRGTQGTVYASGNGYEILTERPGQFQAKGRRGKASRVQAKLPNHEATSAHARNFLDCIKTRDETHCPLEEGHRSTIFAHLANIALATGQKLDWDAENERFTNSPEANELLEYEYRSPYKLPTV
ncbi:Inositol 2-dehydrogenase [Planctomycetes bacterium Pan216]|uniref:Inositol 2-dehydrogenase n=1 Tax=Kolteria novifilia TaxID=2527975 RepID=A0A518B8A2_9BACT|nr:Inositol 2-dehydrogenase [Planctomycetes bacterium Pan216]